jgi:hypothetical protein
MKRGTASKANGKSDGRLKKLLNGLKKYILVLCWEKLIFFSYERGTEKTNLERFAASGESAEREKRGRMAWNNTGNDP